MGNITRITKEEIFMKSALLWAERGTCLRAKVGCIITMQDRIISTGYVGSKPGESHCLDEGCIIDPKTGGCIRTIHAERNAIDFAKENIKNSILECKLYVTISPCLDFAEYIVDTHIDHVIYLIKYRDTGPLDYLKECGVKVSQYKGRTA